MRNVKLGLRLALAFGLVLGLMLLAILLAVAGQRDAQDQAWRFERENAALLQTANSLRAAQLDQAVAIRDFVGQTDVERQRVANDALAASEKAYAEAVGLLEQLVTAGEHNAPLRPLVERLKEANAPVAAKLHEAMELSDQAEYQQAQGIVYNAVRPLQAAIAADLRALVATANEVANDRTEAAQASARTLERRLLVVALVALLIGIATTFRITRGIVQPLRSAMQVAERVADGDLTAVRVSSRRDEAGRMLAALGGMRAGLNTLVRAIRQSADAVVGTSERIASGNTELATRTEQQAAALEESAAALEELTAIVKQNSEGAAQASELAREASRIAEGSGEAVEGVVHSMGGIQKASRKVSEIVGMMDEIAFQTNLLALNAAVEAARAGEHGRGFAVVAQQVRVLAQRSGEAARDIKKLVSAAVDEADQGARKAEQAGVSMAQVVRVARDVAQVVGEIARGSDEQRAGIEQVNTTIAQMDTATQGNAALVQEINDAIARLVAHARELVEASSRFRLESGPADAPAASVAPVGGALAPLPAA